MDLKLKGKKAIVCGGSKGIGRGIAEVLVQEGVTVALVARHAEILDSIRKELDPAEKGNVSVFPFDLSKTEEIPVLGEKILKELKNVHILVNNAGGPPPGTLDDVSNDQWEQTLSQNLKSTIRMTQCFLPLMKQQKFGRIINITSLYVKEPPPNMILSNTARAGVVAFAKSLSHDVGRYGITINTICPGPIATDRMKELLERKAEKEGKPFREIEAATIKQIPMGRMGNPEDIGALAAFLCSEKSGFINGTAICVDGGMTKALF